MVLQGWTEGAFVDWIRLNVVMMNPPGHTRLRKLVSRAFTPRAVAAMREVSQRVADELCDAVDANDGKVEFVRKYDVDTGKFLQFWTGIVTLA